MRCKSTRVCYVARASLHRQRVELSKQNSARYLHFDKSALPAGHSDAENSLISYFNTFFHRNQNRTIVLGNSFGWRKVPHFQLKATQMFMIKELRFQEMLLNQSCEE